MSKVYDVNKCSWCVQGNHRRCHGPCNCAHLAVHANRTCEECGGKGKLPPITHERLVALLMEYPDASEAGIATLLSGAPCPCQEVK